MIPYTEKHFNVINKGKKRLKDIEIMGSGEDKAVNVDELVGHTFTYDDMIKAFSAGRKHMRECGNTQNDCWDFITWLKEQYK